MAEPSVETPPPVLPPKDTRIHDPEKARAMAEAVDPSRSAAARARKIVETFNKHRTDIENLWEKSGGRSWDIEKVTQQEGYKELSQKLLEEIKATNKIYNSMSYPYILEGDYGIREFIRMIPSDVESNAEEYDSRAERREYWAGVLHDHPAEGLQVLDMLKKDKELGEAKRLKVNLQDGINTLEGKGKPAGEGITEFTIWFSNDYARVDLEEDAKRGIELTDKALEERQKQFDEDPIGSLSKTADKVDTRVKNMENTLQQIQAGTYKVAA